MSCTLCICSMYARYKLEQLYVMYHYVMSPHMIEFGLVVEGSVQICNHPAPDSEAEQHLQE